MQNRLALSAALLCCLCGCIDSYAPGGGEVNRAAITEAAIQNYLAEAELARPEVVRRVTVAVKNGRNFRDRVMDQKNRWCLATVWLDKRNTLHVVTCRNETCPECHGTGKRTWGNQTMQNMPFDTRCLKCKGKGFLEDETVERKYTLSAADYVDTRAAENRIKADTYAKAPAGAEEQVQLLGSPDPAKRLAACLWLDRNYVREGMFFQDLLPMLKMARNRDQDKKTMVWQFWAGRGLTGENARAYYRVYADVKTGKVKSKGFYPEN